jgi:gas vesicle protein
MKRKFLRGMAAGALMGAAAGLLFMPEMNNSTRNKIGKATRKFTGFTSNLWDQMADMRR